MVGWASSWIWGSSSKPAEEERQSSLDLDDLEDVGTNRNKAKAKVGKAKNKKKAKR